MLGNIVHWIFFAVKNNVVSEIIKEILNYILEEFDGGSRIKNLNLN